MLSHLLFFYQSLMLNIKHQYLGPDQIQFVENYSGGYVLENLENLIRYWESFHTYISHHSSMKFMS